MTNLLARILLSIMVFPLAALVYLLLIFGAGVNRGPRDSTFVIATVGTAVFVAAYWLWRSSVRWTRERIALTVGSGVGVAVIGLVTGLAMMQMSSIRDAGFGIFIGGLCAIVLWLPITIVLWRENAEERAERIARSAGDVVCCPRCGYNLTGLREARCPECGAQYTLDQLLAAQRREEIGEAAARS